MRIFDQSVVCFSDTGWNSVPNTPADLTCSSSLTSLPDLPGRNERVCRAHESCQSRLTVESGARLALSRIASVSSSGRTAPRPCRNVRVMRRAWSMLSAASRSAIAVAGWCFGFVRSSSGHALSKSVQGGTQHTRSFVLGTARDVVKSLR